MTLHEMTMEEKLTATLESLKRKLKAGSDGGPFGPMIELTPNEAVLAWRLLFGDARR